MQIVALYISSALVAVVSSAYTSLITRKKMMTPKMIKKIENEYKRVLPVVESGKGKKERVS